MSITEIDRFVEHDVLLRDGRKVNIRPIVSDDASKLQALFKRLSTRSIYFRFLGYRKELTDDEAQYFTDVDYQNQMALVATIENDRDESLIGVARYANLSISNPAEAEFAIVVEDQYQGFGLGTKLLHELINYARAHGICTFSAVIHNNNNRIWHILRSTGLSFERMSSECGVSEIRIRLMPESVIKAGESHDQNFISAAG